VFLKQLTTRGIGMKLLTVIGARPQFIKAAPFSEAFRRKNTEILLHTGQHYDSNMSGVFFDELRIPKPDYNLGIGSGRHGAQTARMIEGIESVIYDEKPDGLLVYGDTNSTLAGSLAASKLHVPIFHVEAGLRSYNKLMPEEQNRVLTDHISDILLCPTQTAVENLKKEGITTGVYNTGDIMYDAVVRNIEIANEKYRDSRWFDELVQDNGSIPQLITKKFYLATIHRSENTDNPVRLKEIFDSLNKLDMPVLIPIHPRTRKLIHSLNYESNNLIIVNPVGYLLMLCLTKNAHMIITDSGGLQKEAYFIGTPCTTLRDQTEWVETLSDDWNRLSAIDEESIICNACREVSLLSERRVNLFGDGRAAHTICEIITRGG